MHLVEIAVEPASRSDAQALAAALLSLLAADPSFSVVTDPLSGEPVLQAMSEEALVHPIDVLSQVHGTKARFQPPRAACREALGRSARIDYSYKRQTHGPGQYAVMTLAFGLRPPWAGLDFVSQVAPSRLPSEYVAGVEAGLRAVSHAGLISSFPLCDFRAALLDGAYHDVNSSAHSFNLAAQGAFRQLKEEAALVIVEPLMRVEVTAPHRLRDKIVADLERRRGSSFEVEPGSWSAAITALAPLAHLFGYPAALRTLSGGLAKSSIAFTGFGPITRDM